DGELERLEDDEHFRRLLLRDVEDALALGAVHRRGVAEVDLMLPAQLRDPLVDVAAWGVTRTHWLDPRRAPGVRVGRNEGALGLRVPRRRRGKPVDELSHFENAIGPGPEWAPGSALAPTSGRLAPLVRGERRIERALVVQHLGQRRARRRAWDA